MGKIVRRVVRERSQTSMFTIVLFEAAPSNVIRVVYPYPITDFK